MRRAKAQHRNEKCVKHILPQFWRQPSAVCRQSSGLPKFRRAHKTSDKYAKTRQNAPKNDIATDH
jgi:hypothetical protein